MANPTWLSHDGRWEFTARYSDQCDLDKEVLVLQAAGWEVCGPALGDCQAQGRDTSAPRFWIDFRRAKEGGGESTG